MKTKSTSTSSSEEEDEDIPFLKYLKPKGISKSTTTTTSGSTSNNNNNTNTRKCISTGSTLKTMHRNNKYLVKPPNFAQLSEKYPFFAKYVNSEGKVDWNNAESMVNLTKVLLKDDYRIEWNLPLNHLCPPVANRVNYIHWINDLLEIGGKSEEDSSISNSNHNIIGIDVGTGASCIYSLLGLRIYGWKFIGTDICEESLKIAKENVESNDFQNGICLVQIDKDSGDILKSIIPSLKEKSSQSSVEWTQSIDSVQFTMCNPPFFDIDEEIKRNPNNDCRGNENEMITEGGEETFVKNMMNDSLYLMQKRDTFDMFKNCWFTSMIGKKRSLQSLKEHITNMNVNTINNNEDQHLKNMKVSFHTTEFIQGQTTRWGLAWRFETALQQVHSKLNNQKISSLAVQKDMFQNIHKGYSHAGLLLTAVQNCLQKYKDLVTISKIESTTIRGYLAQDRKQNFEIVIIQTQPKKFTMKTSYKGQNDVVQEIPLAFSQLYEILSREIFSKCI